MNARGTMIRVQRRSVWAGSNNCDGRRAQTDFEPKRSAIGILRAQKCAWYTRGMGQYEYRLKSLADDELLAGLSSIVGRRNQITAEFLAYLAELDERQIFLDLGFASLFEYCLETLGLCESTAGRHIAAARVCRKHRRCSAWFRVARFPLRR